MRRRRDNAAAGRHQSPVGGSQRGEAMREGRDRGYLLTRVLALEVNVGLSKRKESPQNTSERRAQKKWAT